MKIQIEIDVFQGYQDGRDLYSLPPGPNRSDAYRHGFRNGRDDAEIWAGIKRWPSRSAQEARKEWDKIVKKAMC